MRRLGGVDIIAVFMLVMGVGIGSIWTRDIISAEQLEVSRSRWRARDPQSGSLMLPHWIAEYGTATGLVAAAVGLFIDAGWGRPLALVALGALVYTSINSLGWARAERARLPYAVPMAVGVLGGLVAIIVLLAR